MSHEIHADPGHPREERIRIVHQALWGACGIGYEFCSGCDSKGGERLEAICKLAWRRTAEGRPIE